MEIEKAYNTEEERKKVEGKPGKCTTFVTKDGETFRVNTRMSATEIRSAEDKKKFKKELFRGWLAAKVEKSLADGKTFRNRYLKK